MTDAEGIARLRIDTTRFARGDSEFTVEARVVDASRREVIGRGSLRVTRRPWRPMAGRLLPGACFT